MIELVKWVSLLASLVAVAIFFRMILDGEWLLVAIFFVVSSSFFAVFAGLRMIESGDREIAELARQFQEAIDKLTRTKP